MDAIFGPENFRNEIIWKRTSSHNDSRKWPHIHDVILFYARAGFTWNPVYLGHDPEYVADFYRYTDGRGRYRLHEIIRTASMGPRPNLSYEYEGYKPQWGWRMVREKVEALEEDDRIEWAKSGRPYLKRYLDEQEGTPASSIWVDIPPLSAMAAEKLGYPTRKPLVLLERIVAASSNPGDVVLDPFCGCGTALIAAEKLGRKWVGIDVTYLSIAVMESRLAGSFPSLGHVKVIGQPTEVEGARMLAEQSLHDRYEFQYWALTQIGAQPVGDKKKGADAGIDGRIAFTEAGNDVRFVLVSVKSGRRQRRSGARPGRDDEARGRAARTVRHARRTLRPDEARGRRRRDLLVRACESRVPERPDRDRQGSPRGQAADFAATRAPDLPAGRARPGSAGPGGDVRIVTGPGPTELEAAWDVLHAATPPGWFVGSLSFTS